MIAGAALTRLKSTNPQVRRGAAVWFAENQPTNERQQGEVAAVLAGMLDDPLSPGPRAGSPRRQTLGDEGRVAPADRVRQAHQHPGGDRRAVPVSG